MKRIITLLLIILVSNPVIGQITKQNEQELENLQNFKIFKSSSKLQKKVKDFKFSTNKVNYTKSTADDKKTLDSVVNKEWDDDYNIWRNDLKQSFIYDGEHVDTGFISFWDTDTNNWEDYINIEYDFDDYGNVILEIRSVQTSPNVWVLDSKTEYTYIDDSSNPHRLILEETFSREDTEWVKTLKYDFTYDNSNTFVILEVESIWDTNEWVEIHQDEYFYSNGLLDYEINYNYSFSSSQMEQYSKSEYSWGSPYIETVYYYDSEEDDWVKESKYEYEYTTLSGSIIQVTKETGFTWDGSEWKNYYLDDYKYDSEGNRTTASYYEWIEDSEGSGTWYEYSRDKFVFDYDYSFQDDLIGPFNYAESAEDTFFAFNNMVIAFLEYEYINDIWVESYKTIFYYSDYNNQLSVKDKLLADAVRVYPNPATDFLTIDSKIPILGVEVYNILGEKIMDVRSNFNSIPLSNISNGIYIFKIQSENGVLIKRIINK
ncbi:T9SS type A sorting domain-containing protein [Algibacter sp.]|uniref:T9SS type A sorting domain-containing protein n=1 Tax=Algibacter sp. TaxID=1872428 RepID=UPI003C743407